MAESSAFDQIKQALNESLGVESAKLAIECIIKTCGGDRVYIPQHQKPEILPGETPKDLQRRLKISRSTSYYWHKKHRI